MENYAQTRNMSKMSTLIKRWDIRRHPLYKAVYNSLVYQMTVDISDLGRKYLPPALLARAPTDGDSTEMNVIIPATEKAPRSKAVRYSQIRNITGSIEEYAKSSAELFKMVIKALIAIKQN